MKRIFKGRNTRENSGSKLPKAKSPEQSTSVNTTASSPNKTKLERTVPVPSPEKIDGHILKTNIEVCARIRPLRINSGGKGFFSTSNGTPNSKSKQGNGFRLLNGKRSLLNEKSGSKPLTTNENIVAWDVSGDGETAAQSGKTQLIQGRTHSYTLDHVYGVDSNTKQLYQRSIKSLVDRAMEGYHSSILAYGQTSTGKTFTMSGTRECPGLIPLAIVDCFRFVQESQESREYLIRVSYLEIYKENIRDLLNPTPQPIRLFDGPTGLVIRGLKEEIVSSPDQVYSILSKGERRRQVGATHMNQHSSRSHVMVRLWIESTAVDDADVTRVSSLSLVDLAGSESVKLNGADRREEGHYINKSLMTLGQVVLSLSEGKTGHIPYRDSKLTRLLQPSLSGNAQMVLLCCISPLSTHIEESHNTFKFATRAKNVEQKAVINVADDDQTLLQTYKSEIEELRKQLAEAKEEQQNILKKSESSEDSVGAISTQETADGEIKELVEAIKTMERLILRSKPHQESRSSPPFDDDLDILLGDDTRGESIDDFDDDDLLIDIPNRTPPKKPNDDALHRELDRIRGLLGSVLQKRGGVSPDSKTDPRRKIEFESPPRTPKEEKEVATLRKQLEKHEMTTNLRKADSSFLQNQLKEKDQLLEEVYKILDALETRQSELENENANLRAQVASLKHVK